MKTYELTLKHDNGVQTFKVFAEDLGAAMNHVCAVELAPRSAIKSWRVVPKPGEPRRFKNHIKSI